ncbi:hypothetical protein [Alteromonas facilis]|uniref:hypothetical protein n=1 Tax=Alteromonas facilis TaxID=2048004 RepID=UPI000C28A69D|nr:hypothetical protein [Alteromonas facilis]
MTTRAELALPDLLKKALEQHRNQADIADDDDLRDLMGKLDNLSEKVSFYKNKIKSRRGGA